MVVHVRIELDGAGYYIAAVPELPGCMTQGRTHDEASENIREAIMLWLDAVHGSRSIYAEKDISVVM